MREQIADRFGIDFHDLQGDGRVLQQVLRQHPGARPDLENVDTPHSGICGARQGVDDGAGHRLVGQKMLSERLLGTDRLHQRAMKYLYIRAMP